MKKKKTLIIILCIIPFIIIGAIGSIINNKNNSNGSNNVNTNANYSNTNTNTNNASSNSNNSNSSYVYSGIEGTYYPQINEVYPDTEDYADYIIDVGTPSKNQVYVKFYSRNGNVLYSDYVTYKDYGKESEGNFEFNTNTHLGVINVKIIEDKYGRQYITAKRKGQITGAGCTFKKR